MAHKQTTNENPANFEHDEDTNYIFGTTGHAIRSEDEFISLSFAEKSLHQVRCDIEARTLKAEKLLDLSAEALDEAALAMKAVNEWNEKYDNDIYELHAKVRSLAMEVLEARRPLLVVSAGSGQPVGAAALKLLSASINSTPDNSTVKKLDTPLIVWASQTGTSKKLAFSLKDRLRSSYGKVECVNMKHVTIEDVSRHLRVYFVCSTFGSGRPPRDGEGFFNSLRCAKDNSIWSGVQFGVASLGNSAFDFFAVFGQMLSHELRERGAEEILPVALLDRKDGKKKQKNDFKNWEEVVLRELQGVKLDEPLNYPQIAPEKSEKMGRRFSLQNLFKKR